MNEKVLRFANKTWSREEIIRAMVKHMTTATEKKPAWLPKCLFSSPDAPMDESALPKMYSLLLKFTEMIKPTFTREFAFGALKIGQDFITAASEESFQETGFVISDKLLAKFGGSESKFFEEHFVGYTPARGKDITAVFLIPVDRDTRDKQWQQHIESKRPTGTEYLCPHSWYKYSEVDQELAKSEKECLETQSAEWWSIDRIEKDADRKTRSVTQIILDDKLTESVPTNCRISGVVSIFYDREIADPWRAAHDIDCIQVFTGDRHDWPEGVKEQWKNLFWDKAPYQVYTTEVNLYDTKPQ